MNKEETWKAKIPITVTTVSFILSLYALLFFWVRGISIIKSQWTGEETYYGSFLFGSSHNMYLWVVIFVGIFVSLSWLLSTRVTFYQKKYMRLVTFYVALLTIWGGFASYGMKRSRERMIPYFEERLANVIETDGFFESIVFEHTDGFYLMVLLIPVILLSFVTLFVMTKYVQHDKELNEAFFEFQWSGKWLQKFSKIGQNDLWPNIELGPNSKTGEMVVLPGYDRTLNTMIIGPIGTGKTAALGLPTLQQDLDHMVEYINQFPTLYKREDFRTEDVGGRFLNGISIIDPSNDLCQKTLKLVKAHGIPDEAITYINPLDPNTPSINPMRGPVDKVAEVFAQVIAGLNDSKDGGNFFFEQAQRNHLKHYIYLLKLHDTKIEVTFDMLLDMYNNPQLVHKMHVKLKATLPTEIDNIENRDERNYWKIVQGIDDWFNLNLLQMKDHRTGIPERTDDGEVAYYDAKAEHVQGLRNILNDIGANPLIRRVLFGKSDFDFDRHMEIGGVLLVNTAKGELVNLARVLGKIVLMNLQNATFRRPPNISSFHHILVDEAPDYLYNAFREFPAQSRKYKVILTTLKQTIAQLADQFGEYYMTTLIAAMRNRMVYGDLPAYDAKYFSEIFGERFVYEEGQSEMAVSPLQEDPMSRTGFNYSKKRESAMTSADIIFQDAFQCAVKIVANNKPMPVVQIKANFVNKRLFEQADKIVNDESLSVWLHEREMYGKKQTITPEIEELISIEESDKKNEEHYEADRMQAFFIDSDEIEKAVSIKTDPNPRDPIIYQSQPPKLNNVVEFKKPNGERDSVQVKDNKIDEPLDWMDAIQDNNKPEQQEEQEKQQESFNTVVDNKEQRGEYKPSEVSQEEMKYAQSMFYEEIDED